MAKFSTDLDRAFFALADPTRRAIVSRLCDGPKSLSELSEPFELALPSLLKHVRVLEQSGLVFVLIYIWVGALSVLVPTQVWTLASFVMTTREAKRAFGLIG